MKTYSATIIDRNNSATIYVTRVRLDPDNLLDAIVEVLEQENNERDLELNIDREAIRREILCGSRNGEALTIRHDEPGEFNIVCSVLDCFASDIDGKDRTRSDFPSVKRLFAAGEKVWWEDDHMTGWGKVTDVNQVAFNGKFLAGPDDIILITKEDNAGEIETTASHVYQLVTGALYKGNPVVWDHNDEEYMMYCPATLENIDADELDGDKKEFEVDIFVLGCGEETKQTVTVSARTQEEAERLAVKPNSGWGVLGSRPAESGLDSKLNELLCGKSIDEAQDLLEEFGEVSFCDEKIDDASDDENDSYVMMRSYDVGEHHVRIYFGNNSRTIGCVEVN